LRNKRLFSSVPVHRQQQEAMEYIAHTLHEYFPYHKNSPQNKDFLKKVMPFARAGGRAMS
jgi:hypothetical protein